MIGRRVATRSDLERPGDYTGPVDVGGDATGVFFLKPNARDPGAPPRARGIQWVRSPPHRFRECPDGSLEIRESIGATAGRGGLSDGWHGYLDEGHVWRFVDAGPGSPPAAPPGAPPGPDRSFDPCACGDLRHHHSLGPCAACHDRTGVWVCAGFEVPA